MYEILKKDAALKRLKKSDGESVETELDELLTADENVNTMNINVGTTTNSTKSENSSPICGIIGTR